MKFLKTISVEEFKSILDGIPRIKVEEELINLEESFNRVIARNVISNIW